MEFSSQIRQRWTSMTLKALTVMSLTGLILIFATSAYGWVPQKYVDSVNFPGSYMMGTPDTASRSDNKIWHPTPSNFCSHFPPEITSYKCDMWVNPVDDQRSVFNSYAHCLNMETVYIYPVTCQTNRP
jgi:hypothetical protein